MGDFGKNKPRNYIKAVDLQKGDKVVFINGGEWVKKDFSTEQDGSKEKVVYVARVSVNGEEPKELTINATSGNSLAEKWGEEGDGWKGKTAKVDFVKMVTFGEMKNVLCLVPEGEPEGWQE